MPEDFSGAFQLGNFGLLNLSCYILRSEGGGGRFSLLLPPSLCNPPPPLPRFRNIVDRMILSSTHTLGLVVGLVDVVCGKSREVVE